MDPVPAPRVPTAKGPRRTDQAFDRDRGGDQPTTDHFGQGESKNTKRRQRQATRLDGAGPGCEIDHRLTPPPLSPSVCSHFEPKGEGGLLFTHTHKSRVCLYNTYLLNHVTVCLLGSNRGWREEGRRGKPPPPPFSSGQVVDKHPISGIVPPPLPHLPIRCGVRHTTGAPPTRANPVIPTAHIRSYHVWAAAQGTNSATAYLPLPRTVSRSSGIMLFPGVQAGIIRRSEERVLGNQQVGKFNNTPGSKVI